MIAPPPPPYDFFFFFFFFFFCLSAQRSVMAMIIPLPHYEVGGGGECVGVPLVEGITKTKCPEN